MRCVECQKVPEGIGRGWRALLDVDPTGEEPTIVLVYCPRCAEREFGPRFANRNVKPS